VNPHVNSRDLVAFVTGISGSGRYDLLKQLTPTAPDLNIIDVGTNMYQKSRELGVEIPDGKILDMDPLALEYLRAATFEDILKEVEKTRQKGQVAAISTHVCFRWKKHLLHAFNFHYVNLLAPDVYINIIDNAHYIYAALASSNAWRGKLTLKEILVWRDEEAFITRLLAEYQRKPYYVFPRHEDPQMLQKILYDVERAKKTGQKPAPKAYLSYPITHVKGDPEFMKQKDEVKQRLKQAGIVVFDPISIEDSILVDMAYEAEKNGKDTVEIPTETQTVQLPIKQIYEALDDIKDQIVARDYQLINQSDFIVVYYPVTVLSPGVLSEIKYGYTHNKHVYAIFPHQSASPFFEYYTTKIFKDLDTLIQHLQETHTTGENND
jgi:adenylate kinase